MRTFDLADLLTAAGTAMGVSNRRLAVSGAPALLREFSLDLSMSAAVQLDQEGSTLLFQTAGDLAQQLQSQAAGVPNNVTIAATYIAAPSLLPLLPPGGVNDP